MEKLLEVYEIDLKKEISNKLIPDVLDLAKDLFREGK
jgi:hypothetical protein